MLWMAFLGEEGVSVEELPQHQHDTDVHSEELAEVLNFHFGHPNCTGHPILDVPCHCLYSSSPSSLSEMGVNIRWQLQWKLGGGVVRLVIMCELLVVGVEARKPSQQIFPCQDLPAKCSRVLTAGTRSVTIFRGKNS